MKCIVTGGAGFIGSHIVDRLINMGHDVIVFDDLSTGKTSNLNEKAVFRQVDVSNLDELLPWEDDFRGTDAIFHNAASKKNICLRDPARDLQVNSGSSLLLLQLAVKHNVPFVCGASTGSIYGEIDGLITEDTLARPVSYYGVSKLGGERYLDVFNHLHGIGTAILRYFHVVGRRQSYDAQEGGVVAIFKHNIKLGLPIIIHGTGSQTRVFTSVDDVVEANIRAWMFNKGQNVVYNCCNNKPISIIDMAHMLMDKFGHVEIKYGPELLGDIKKFHVDNSKIRIELDMEFTPFEEIIDTL